jgi:hypothetical protein
MHILACFSFAVNYLNQHRDKSLPWMYGINEIVTILYLRQNMAGSCNVEETWMSIPDALLA